MLYKIFRSGVCPLYGNRLIVVFRTYDIHDPCTVSILCKQLIFDFYTVKLLECGTRACGASQFLIQSYSFWEILYEFVQLLFGLENVCWRYRRRLYLFIEDSYFRISKGLNCIGR